MDGDLEELPIAAQANKPSMQKHVFPIALQIRTISGTIPDGHSTWGKGGQLLFLFICPGRFLQDEKKGPFPRPWCCYSWVLQIMLLQVRSIDRSRTPKGPKATNQARP